MAETPVLDSYMWITGTGEHGINVHGEALDAKYGEAKYGFALSSFEWAAERKEAHDSSGNKKAFSYGSAQMHDFEIKKSIDTASAYLFLVCTVCDTLPTATIKIRKHGQTATGLSSFATFEFQELQVKEIKWNIKGEIPEEKVVFGFQQVNVTYYPQDITGVFGQTLPPTVASWSISKNKTAGSSAASDA